MSWAGATPLLSEAEKAELRALVVKGPDPEKDKIIRWRCLDLQADIARRFSVRVHESTANLRQFGLTRLQARPCQPKTNLAAQEAFQKTSSDRQPACGGRNWLRYPGLEGSGRKVFGGCDPVKKRQPDEERPSRHHHWYTDRGLVSGRSQSGSKGLAHLCLVAKAKAGELNLDRTLWAMRRAAEPKPHPNRYWDERGAPRDESFKEDVRTALQSRRPDAEVWRNLRAAAESGWDFSSRWLADGRTLNTIQTLDLLPPDLNGALVHLEQTPVQGIQNSSAISDVQRSTQSVRDSGSVQSTT